MVDPLDVYASDYPFQTYMVTAVIIGLAGYNYKADVAVLWDNNSSPGELLHVAVWLTVLAVRMLVSLFLWAANAEFCEPR